MAARRDPLPESLVAWALLGLAIASAFPLGGNRPALWMVQASVSCALTAILLFAAARRGSRFPAGPGNDGRPDLRPLLLLGGIWAAAMAVLQILPGAGMPMPALSLDAQNSLIGGLRQLGTTAFAFATLQAFRRRHRAGRAAALLLCGIALHAAYGFAGLRLDTLLLPGEIAYPGFLTGAFVNRNSFATLLGMGVVLAIALMCSPLPWRRSQGDGADTLMWRAGFALAAVFLITSLLATGSRMGVLSTAAGLATLGLCLLGRGRGSWQGLVLILAPLFILPVLLLAGSGTLFDRMMDLAENADSRLALYRATLTMICDAPFLGTGLDNFPQGFRQYQTLSVSPDLRWNDAHSTYLENWAELGLFVGTLPILIGLAAGALLLRRIRASKSRDPLSIAALSALVIGALHTSVDFSLEIQGVLLPLILLIGLSLSPAPPLAETEV